MPRPRPAFSYLSTWYGALLALASPDLRGQTLFLEIHNFFLQHAVLLVLPMLWIAQRRFHLYEVRVQVLCASAGIDSPRGATAGAAPWKPMMVTLGSLQGHSTPRVVVSTPLLVLPSPPPTTPARSPATLQGVFPWVLCWLVFWLMHLDVFFPLSLVSGGNVNYVLVRRGGTCVPTPTRGWARCTLPSAPEPSGPSAGNDDARATATAAATPRRRRPTSAS